MPANKNLLFCCISLLFLYMTLLLPFSVVAEQVLILPGHEKTEIPKNTETDEEPIFLLDSPSKEENSPVSNEASESILTVSPQDSAHDNRTNDSKSDNKGEGNQLETLENLSLGEKIITLLGNDTYAMTYAYLADGNTIKNGYNGKAAKGLQQLIVALGAKVATDGQVGAKTIAAINQVAEGYARLNEDGRIASVDLAVFEDLLLAMLLQEDEQAAIALLENERDSDKILELYQASSELQKGNRFTARNMYLALDDFRSSKLRAAKTNLPWPKNGQLYRNPDYAAKKCELTVVIGGEKDTATYLKIYTTDEELVLTAFISGGSSVRVSLPVGTYLLKMGVGTEWYGPEEAFGYDNDAQYSRLSLEDGRDTITLQAGYTYALSLSVLADKEGQGVEMAPEKWIDF